MADDNKVDMSCYVANNVSHIQNNEKILFGDKLGDRRKKIISSNDNRSIIKCIGRIKTDHNKTNINGNKVFGLGTGTVFKISASTHLCYVITCAHNVMDFDQINKTSNEPTEMFFQRITTYQNAPPQMMKEYQVLKWIVHPKYNAAERNNDYDLAVLYFTDDNGYYNNLCSNILVSDQDSDEYEINGYPVPNDDNSIVKFGEMWGMKSSASFVNSNNVNINMYTNKTAHLYVYNSIDTEGGQSGVAIFINKNNNYHIVGIHAGGSKAQGKNWGPRLIESKINWVHKATMGPTQFYTIKHGNGLSVTKNIVKTIGIKGSGMCILDDYIDPIHCEFFRVDFNINKYKAGRINFGYVITKSFSNNNVFYDSGKGFIRSVSFSKKVVMEFDFVSYEFRIFCCKQNWITLDAKGKLNPQTKVIPAIKIYDGDFEAELSCFENKKIQDFTDYSMY